ncbi:MAG: class I SAM-dependent methyltransferase [Burkholderiaceae bacterium]|nr:class I SAM-dependent methyltransferase [Burkholderiaceae bacterium]
MKNANSPGPEAAGAILDGEEFERHAERSVHFFSRRVPALLRQVLAGVPAGAAVVDVGCGDGQLVWSLIETGALPAGVTVMGVDLSPVRVKRFTQLTGQPAILANGERLEGVADASVDLCISTMVMEHVPDDAAYAETLARIVKPGGWLFLTTVLRKPGAWYFRRAPDGRRVLDPTHVREYADVATVRRPLEAAGFRVEELRLERLVFPIAHPLVRLLNAARPLRDVQRLFLSAPWSWFEAMALPIPRYREIQLVLRRV